MRTGLVAGAMLATAAGFGASCGELPPVVVPETPSGTTDEGPRAEAPVMGEVEFVEPDIYPAHVAACDAIVGTGCETLCIQLFTTATDEAARRSLDCFVEEQRKLGPDPAMPVCGDACARTTCEYRAFEGPTTAAPDPRCETEVRRGSDTLSIRDLFADSCNQNTPHMNQVGRDRYLACMGQIPAAGQRSCLWDFTRAPCGYDFDHGLDRDEVRDRE